MKKTAREIAEVIALLVGEEIITKVCSIEDLEDNVKVALEKGDQSVHILDLEPWAGKINFDTIPKEYYKNGIRVIRFITADHFGIRYHV